MILIGLNANSKRMIYSYSKRGMDKRQLDGSRSEGETPQKRKKMKPNQEDSSLPLDTGLSLAEDEALVLQLLNN